MQFKPLNRQGGKNHVKKVYCFIDSISYSYGGFGRVAEDDAGSAATTRKNRSLHNSVKLFFIDTSREVHPPKKPKGALEELVEGFRDVLRGIDDPMLEPEFMEFTGFLANLAKKTLMRGSLFDTVFILEALNRRTMEKIVQLGLAGNYPAANTLREVAPELIAAAVAQIMSFIPPIPFTDGPDPCCPCTVIILIQIGGTKGDPGNKFFSKPGDILILTADAKPHCPGPFSWETKASGATGWGYASSGASASFTSYNSGDRFKIKVTHNHGACECTDELEVVVQ